VLREQAKGTWSFNEEEVVETRKGESEGDEQGLTLEDLAAIERRVLAEQAVFVSFPGTEEGEEITSEVLAAIQQVLLEQGAFFPEAEGETAGEGEREEVTGLAETFIATERVVEQGETIYFPDREMPEPRVAASVVIEHKAMADQRGESISFPDSREGEGTWLTREQKVASKRGGSSLEDSDEEVYEEVDEEVGEEVEAEAEAEESERDVGSSPLDGSEEGVSEGVLDDAACQNDPLVGAPVHAPKAEEEEFMFDLVSFGSGDEFTFILEYLLALKSPQDLAL
jgi:hypothetical protein